MIRNLKLLCGVALTVWSYTHGYAQCTEPSSLAVSAITSTTAQTDWTSSGSLFDLQLINVTDTDTTYTNGINTATYGLIGLDPEKDYEVAVRTDCGPFTTPQYSVWTSLESFTTPPSCSPISGLSLDFVSADSAVVSWTQGYSESMWDLELVSGTDTLTYTPTLNDVTTNTYSLSGLTELTDYTLIVRADCGVIDGASAWSSELDFSTIAHCIAPSNLISLAVTNSTIDFSWIANDDETSWEIELVNITNAESPDGSVDYTAVDTFYQVSGLVSESEYAIYVRAVCGGTDGNSLWEGPLSVTTLCDPVSVPYYVDFTSWPAACIDLNGGTANFDLYTSGADSFAVADFWDVNDVDYYLALPILSLTQSAELTFDWSHDDGGYPFDGLEVFASGDNGVTWNSIWVKVGPDLNSNDGATYYAPGSFVTETVLIDYSAYGANPMIRFIAHSDYGPNLFIKSIAVNELPACNTPYFVTVDSIGTTDVDFSFTVAGSGATLYEIELVQGGDTITGVATSTTTASPFNIASLDPATEYSIYVRTLCGADSTDWIGPNTFVTECSPATEYFNDFEGLNTSDAPVCWNFLNDATSTWATVSLYNYSGYAHSGDISVSMSNDYSTGSDLNQYIVGPEFSNVDAGTHRLRFWARNYGSSGNDIIVGTITDPTDYNTFTPMDTIQLTNSHLEYIVPFDGYAGSDNFVAIKNRGNSSYSQIYIDDFEWQVTPTCFPPASVVVDSSTTNSVSLTIDSVGSFGAEWFVELVDVLGVNPTVFDTVNTLSFTINGLESSTSYDVSIATNCIGEISEAFVLNANTDCAPIGNFYNTFENLDSEEDTSLCWDYSIASTSTSTWDYPNITMSTWDACEGSNFIRMYGGDDMNADVLLVTPELNNISAGTNMLTFFATNNSSWAPSSPFEVGTITDANDPSTFTSIYSGVANSGCDSVTVPFVSYAGTDSRIAIKFNQSSLYNELYIDKVKWDVAPACAAPVNYSVENFTDSVVELDWLNVSVDTMWFLEVVDVLDTNDVFDNSPTDTAYSHPFSISGLNENTLYEVYLTNSCDTSVSQFVTFVTQWSNDVGVSSILSPSPTGCSLSDSVQIEVEITNNGAQNQTGFPVELSWDDTTYVNVGTFMDTLLPGESASFTIDGYYDFSTALDSVFWVQTALVSDSVSNNNSATSTVTNLGDMLINVQINTGDYSTEVAWALVDTVNNIVADSVPSQTYQDWNTTYNHEVCVYAGESYVMNAWDTYDDGWNGGTYSITRCGGIILGNNGGNEVTNGISGVSAWDLEATESFVVDPCPDNDLAVMAIDGLESACGLGLETGSVTIMNFGNLDVAANGATAQYQFNNSGLWVDFWDFDTGLGSQEDTVFTMPAVDMSFAGQYTIAVQIVYALDSDSTTNYLDAEVTSVPTLSQDSTTFNNDNGGWTSHLSTGVNNSWEYGIPTTAVAGNGNDQEVWATNLSGDGSLNEESYLLSPCYDFSSYTGTDAEVKFDFVRTDFSHSYNLQYQVDGGSWSTVYYAPSNTNTWTNKTVLVPVGGESDVKFRWFYDATWLNPIEGFAFDNWEVFEHVPYTDATASYINVNGTLVAGFDPDTMSYDVELPYGSALPYVTAGFNAPIVDDLDVDQAIALPGFATVTITAEDTNFVNVYTVNFTEAAPSNDASLTDLAVSGPSIPGFDPDTLSYTMYMNCGVSPNVVPTLSDPNATFNVIAATNPGVAQVIVTAEDGVTTQTYNVNLLCFILSDDASLSGLSVNGTPLTGFHTDTLEYNVVLPYGTTTVPLVTYATTDAGANGNVTPAGTIPGTTTIDVTAENGTSLMTYIINFTVALNNDAQLLDIAINGSTIIGFSPSVYVYNVELAYNEPIPGLTALGIDPNAVVSITHATQAGETTIIVVLAEDGITTLTYFVNWTEAAPSNDATLDSLMTDFGYFCMISGTDTLAAMTIGDVDENAYSLTVGADFASLVNLIAIPNDANASVVKTGSATVAPYGVIVITVTAQDGVTQEVYTITVVEEDCSIGLDEAILGQISVSPNPSTGLFTIEMPTEIENYNITVVDQLGKVVYQENVLDGSINKDIDLSRLPSGIYNLRLQTVNDFVVKRISVIK